MQQNMKTLLEDVTYFRMHENDLLSIWNNVTNISVDLSRFLYTKLPRLYAGIYNITLYKMTAQKVRNPIPAFKFWY